MKADYIEDITWWREDMNLFSSGKTTKQYFTNERK